MCPRLGSLRGVGGPKRREGEVGINVCVCCALCVKGGSFKESLNMTQSRPKVDWLQERARITVWGGYPVRQRTE